MFANLGLHTYYSQTAFQKNLINRQQAVDGSIPNHHPPPKNRFSYRPG